VPEDERHRRGRQVSGAIGGGGTTVKLRADDDVELDAQGAASAIADRAVTAPSIAPPPMPEAAPSPSSPPSGAGRPAATPSPSTKAEAEEAKPEAP
jgi:hypothetical protein